MPFPLDWMDAPELRRASGVSLRMSRLAHLSPLGWEHVNLTGDYIWGSLKIPLENIVGLTPLRSIPEVTKKAA